MMALVGTLAFNFQVLLPLLARYSFHGGPEAYATLMIAMGAGSVAGALVAGARGRVSAGLLIASSAAFGALHVAGGARAHPHPGGRGARADGRGERDLRGGGELHPAARGGAGHAGTRDGPLLGGIPGLDAHRRAVGGVAGRAAGPARGWCSGPRPRWRPRSGPGSCSGGPPREPAHCSSRLGSLLGTGRGTPADGYSQEASYFVERRCPRWPLPAPSSLSPPRPRWRSSAGTTPRRRVPLGRRDHLRRLRLHGTLISPDPCSARATAARSPAPRWPRPRPGRASW